MKFFTQDAEDFLWDLNEEEDDWTDEDISSQVLQEKMSKIVPYTFWDYVRKYIFMKGGFDGTKDFDEIEDEVYIKIAKESFAIMGVPIMNPYKKDGILKKNLNDNFVESQYHSRKTTAKTSRVVALKWCFGLGMDSSEATVFMKKAFRQTSFNFRCPYECILEYVMRMHQDHSKAIELLRKYSERMDSVDFTDEVHDECNDTKYFQDRMQEINDECELIDALVDLARENIIDRKMAKEECYPKNIDDDFFENMKNHTLFPSQSQIEKYEQLFNMYKNNLIEIERRNRSEGDCRTIQLKDDEITNIDIDEIIDYTNIDSELMTNVYSRFEDGHEESFQLFIANWSNYISDKIVSFTEHKIEGLTKRTREFDRYEVILLCFLNYLAEMKLKDKRKERNYWHWNNYVNTWLEDMGYQFFYLPNPFECFLALCLLSSYPEETFKVSVVISKHVYGRCFCGNIVLKETDGTARCMTENCEYNHIINYNRNGKQRSEPDIRKFIIDKIGNV